MPAFLYYLSATQNQDPVCHLDCRKAMRDHDRRLAASKILQGLEQF
jgi:hypothetical protein